MGEASVFLSGQMALALDGSEVSLSELTSVLPDPSILSPAEKAAWIELRYWGDEAVLRSNSERLKDFSVNRLRHLLRSLKRLSMVTKEWRS